MENIKNIIFDLGGVILDIDFKKLENSFIEIGITNFPEFFGLGHAAAFFKDHESGKISDEEFLDSIQRLAKHSVEPSIIQKAWNSLLIKFPPERIELLRKLKIKYRLFLLSNTNAIHLEAFQKIYQDAFGHGSLEDLFEKVYYSHQIGLRKPNKEIYEYVMKDSEMNPEQTLLIDDALVNVEAARKAGMQAIHLKPGMSLSDLDWGDL
jgi:putative hydrolase of the HAD superfamily